MKKMTSSVLSLAALVVMCSSAVSCASSGGKLTTGQKVGLAGYVALSAYDYAQTREILKDKNYREVNPIIGNGRNALARALAIKALSAGAVYAMTVRSAQETRGAIITAAVVLQFAVCAHNYMIGVRVSW